MSQKTVKVKLLLSIFVDVGIKNILSSDFGLVFRLALSFFKLGSWTLFLMVWDTF